MAAVNFSSAASKASYYYQIFASLARYLICGQFFMTLSIEFLYEFQADLTLSQHPTEVFIPDLQYPGKSYLIDTSVNLNWEPSTANERLILFQHDGSTEDSYIRITKQI